MNEIASQIGSCYFLLGVAPDADALEIRRAWRVQVARLHPDRAPGAGERLRAVNTAYAILKDPARRAAHDVMLARNAAKMPLIPARLVRVPGKPPTLYRRSQMPGNASRLGRFMDLLREVLWPFARPPEAHHGR